MNRPESMRKALDCVEAMNLSPSEKLRIKLALKKMEEYEALLYFHGKEEDWLPLLKEVLLGKGSTSQTPAKRPRIESELLMLEKLLTPPPDMIGMDQLAAFLTDHTERKLPVSPDMYEELVTEDSYWKEYLQPSKSKFARWLSGQIILDPYTAGGVQNTIVNSQNLIGTFLYCLEKCAPMSRKLAFHYDRDASTSSATSSYSTLQGCRPNFWLTVYHRLLMAGVDKPAAQLLAARKDLIAKAVKLNHQHYGPVRFLLLYCASGDVIEFHYSDMEGQVHGLGPKLYFKTSSMMERIALFCTMINIYRLLLVAQDNLPDLGGAMPENVWSMRRNGNELHDTAHARCSGKQRKVCGHAVLACPEAHVCNACKETGN